MEKDANEYGGGSSMDVFDDTILIEIFLLLPLKLMFQCKAVCKQWLLLISSPYFRERVLAKEQDSVSMTWYLLYQHNRDDLRIRSAFQNNPDDFVLNFLFNDKYDPPRLLAAHNGLVLCSKEYYYGFEFGFYVGNPLTRKWVSIPDRQIYSWKLIGFIVSCNDGNTIFKVVRLLHGGSNFQVFSSDVGQWWDTGVAFPDVKEYHFAENRCVVHDGILYWMVGKRASRSYSLIAFDPDKRECRVITDTSVNGLLGATCGRLCYVNYASYNEFFYPGEVLSVCLLDNNDTEKWSPLLTTRLRSVLEINEIDPKDGRFTLFPLTFHPFDMDIIYFKTDCDSMVSFNISTQKLTTEVEFPTEFFWKMPQFFLFALPPWPSSVPQPIGETTSVDIHDDFSSYFGLLNF